MTCPMCGESGHVIIQWTARQWSDAVELVNGQLVADNRSGHQESLEDDEFVCQRCYYKWTDRTLLKKVKWII